MFSNLSYLFLSGLILGSGPCLGLCAPILMSYAAAHKKGWAESARFYLTFSLFKITGYVALSLVFFLGINFLKQYLFNYSQRTIYLILGTVIILMGIATVFSKNPHSFCSKLMSNNIKSAGTLGILVGLSPCPPLVGIINYVSMVSSKPFTVIILTLVFGAGTIISPLLLLVIFSAKTAQILSKHRKLETAVKIISGLVLVFLGIKITAGLF